MFKKLKNFLKRILPPPVSAFMREIERVLAEIGKQNRGISVIHHDIGTLREEQEIICMQLQQEREKVALLFDNINEVHKQIVATLAELQEQQRQTYTALGGLHSIAENEATHNRKEIESVTHRIERQDVKLVELSKRMQQHERNIISKIDREKQELFYEYYSRLKPEEYERELALWYRKRTGKVLNLSAPKTYNEKIQWLKLYDSTPLKTRLADKYLVREWVKEKIGEEYLIPLLGAWDSFDEIDFDSLPDKFVLKANHGSGWNIIVKDKATLDRDDARKKLNRWLRKNDAFRGFELQYLNIPPKIIAEEYLVNDNCDLYDYKVLCYGGKAQNIMFISGRTQEPREAIFDLDWNRLPFTRTYPRLEGSVPKPKNLGLLISLSEQLAADFAHARIDFYVLNDGSLKFGEITFTPANGCCNWNPQEQDKIQGELIQLPPKSPSPQILY